MKPAAYLISNATARELRFEALASDDKWHSYTTPPVETALYAIPADQVLVPRELLERIANDDEGMADLSDFEELKRLLHP